MNSGSRNTLRMARPATVTKSCIADDRWASGRSLATSVRS